MATADQQYVDAAAAEVGRHIRGGEGWALGLAIASCVAPGTGQGARQPRSDRSEVGKVSATDFAKKAKTSKERVLRFRQAWEKAAVEGLVPYAEDLVPEDWDVAENIPKNVEWGKFYDASASGGRPRDSKVTDAVTIIERRGAEAVVEAAPVSVQRALRKALDVTPANPKAVATAIASDPALAKAVAANSDADAAVRQARGERAEERDKDIRAQGERQRRERMEQDMRDGIDPTDSLSTRAEGLKDGLTFSFVLGGMARDLRKAVEEFQRDGFTPTDRDEVRLHAPKIRAALDDLVVLVETGDVDDEAEQLLGGK